MKTIKYAFLIQYYYISIIRIMLYHIFVRTSSKQMKLFHFAIVIYVYFRQNVNCLVSTITTFQYPSSHSKHPDLKILWHYYCIVDFQIASCAVKWCLSNMSIISMVDKAFQFPYLFKLNTLKCIGIRNNLIFDEDGALWCSGSCSRLAIRRSWVRFPTWRWSP